MVYILAGKGYHRFFSCGLYGFCEHNKYPVMLSQEWFEMKNIK